MRNIWHIQHILCPSLRHSAENAQFYSIYCKIVLILLRIYENVQPAAATLRAGLATDIPCKPFICYGSSVTDCTAEKEIHENHVFQLYGSAVQLTVESEQNYTPVFITTTKLSDVARQCAIFLNIELYECFAYEDYPVIKCNISSSGEKIYHLPFDQQYDRVRIIPSNGEVYASTVAEAEKLGFRRAHRWRDTERKGK